MKSILRNKYVTVGAITAATVIVIIYAITDPVRDGYAPRCFLKATTGYDCPGCGFQRALGALLRGHISEAWHYNAYLFFALPLALLYLVAEEWPLRCARLRRFILSPMFLAILAAATMAWWIIRNIV